MTKHMLSMSFQNGISLVAQNQHEALIKGLDLALSSRLLADVDVHTMSLPRDVKGEKMYRDDDDGEVAMLDDFWPSRDSWFSAYRPYIVKEGVLTIPVKGALLHGVGITFGQYMTGYDYLIRAVMRGEADPEVKRVVFLIHSPGGHVAGCFDFCDMVWDMKKPTVAFISDMACSAGYAVAASCKKVIGTQTVMAGNIGVLATRVDESKALDKMGVQFHYVSAPEDGHKADFHMGNPITAEMLARIQPEVNETYEIFVKTVARGRPMSEEQIRATKALDYRKESSLSLGLIDMVASSVNVIAAALDVDFESEVKPNADEMSAANTEEPEMDQKELDAKLATARQEGAQAAQAAATARISAILGSAEAAGREDLAKHFAFNTVMSAEDAEAALKVSPKAVPVQPDPAAAATAAAAAAAEAATKAATEEAAKRTAAFEEAMGKSAPNLSPNAETSGDGNGDTAKTNINASLDLARRAGIGGYKTA